MNEVCVDQEVLEFVALEHEDNVVELVQRLYNSYVASVEAQNYNALKNGDEDGKEWLDFYDWQKAVRKGTL